MYARLSNKLCWDSLNHKDRSFIVQTHMIAPFQTRPMLLKQRLLPSPKYYWENWLRSIPACHCRISLSLWGFYTDPGSISLAPKKRHWNGHIRYACLVLMHIMCTVFWVLYIWKFFTVPDCLSARVVRYQALLTISILLEVELGSLLARDGSEMVKI